MCIEKKKRDAGAAEIATERLCGGLLEESRLNPFVFEVWLAATATDEETEGERNHREISY